MSDDLDKILDEMDDSDSDEVQTDNLDNLLDAIVGPDSDEEDLDAILEALMAQKQEDDEEGRGPNENFLQSIESMTGEEEINTLALSEDNLPEGAVIYGEKKQKKEKKKPAFKLSSIKEGVKNSKIIKEIKAAPKILRIAIVAMAAVMMLSFVGVAVVFAISRRAYDDDNVHRIQPPYSGFNTANHAFVDLAINVGREDLILRRILLDAAATTFYFEGNVDVERFFMALTDFQDNIYRQDITFATNTMRQLSLNHTAVRFQAVNPEAQGLTLAITDLETGVRVDVDLGFYQGGIPLARHFNHPITFETDELLGINVQMTHGLFSGGGSTVGLSLSHNFTDGGFVLKQRENVASVVLRQGSVFLPPISGELETANFDSGVEISRMDFGPLRTLGGDISVILDGLYRYFDINYTMPISPLLVPGDSREQELWLDSNHTVTIEGMVRQGPLFVMPLGGVRSTLVYDEHYEIWQREENRVPTTMIASLVFIDNNGITHRLEGAVRYDFRGTDVVFDTRNNINFEGVSGALINLEIQTIYMNLARTTHTIDLNAGDIAPAEENILRARLIEEHFAGAAHTGGILEPFAQVSTMKVDGNMVFAIVKEMRPRLENGRFYREIITHRVAGEFVGGQFVPHNVQSTQ